MTRNENNLGEYYPTMWKTNDNDAITIYSTNMYLPYKETELDNI